MGSVETSSGNGEVNRRPRRRQRRWSRLVGVGLLIVAVLGVAARLAMPSALRWYVNRTLDRTPLYNGRIGEIQVHLWRGAYSIEDIRLNKTSGNVPVPLFSARRLDLAIQWDALLHGRIVGRVLMEHPELNFVDAGDESKSQTGAGGPWLDILSDLFPFKINSAVIQNGSIHFRAYERTPPVDLYFSHVDATADNLTNIRDDTAPLLATVKASGMAMDQAKFEYEMKLDPFSYKPSFEMAVRLLGLDVRKLNDFAKAYGGVDFKSGFFDLVVEVTAREGLLSGYVKPLFRHLQVFSPEDLTKGDPLALFWQAVVGVTTEVLKNQPRDQLATEISLSGDLDSPQVSVFSVVMNVLRNAFVRAYSPKLRGTTGDINHLEFGKGSITDPSSVGAD